jgi:hypothetical protein
MANRMMRWFEFQHLPVGPIRAASAECAALARIFDDRLPESAEKTAGLRKLLEAKDCFVRATIEAGETRAEGGAGAAGGGGRDAT